MPDLDNSEDDQTAEEPGWLLPLHDDSIFDEWYKNSLLFSITNWNPVPKSVSRLFFEEWAIDESVGTRKDWWTGNDLDGPTW